MTDEHETSRRWFLRTSAVTIGAAGLAGCGENPPTGGDEETTTTETTTTTTTTETTTRTTTAGPEGAERIELGEARLLEIQEDAPTDPERGDRADPVVFEAEAGMGVEITMRSDDVDPLLVLEAPDGSVVAEDDDGADGLNSRIRMVLEQSGTYTIWAGTFSGNETGSYVLAVESYEPAERRSIAIGETGEYEIRENDGADPARGELAAPIEFEGEADTWVVIDMESEAFDTLLILEGPDGEVVTGDDDGGEGLNSRIRVELEQSGTYTIWASSFDGSDTGPFTLGIEEVEIGAAGTRSIAVGETNEYEIRPNDSIDPARESLAAPVEFEGTEDRNVEITMTSEEIDTYLVLEAPDGEIVARNDDGGDRLNSRIRTTLGQSGTYTIWCGSFGRSETGPFTLSVEEFEPAEPRSIAIGETDTYEILPNDRSDPERGSLAAPVEFEGEPDVGVDIAMTSDEFDTYLVLEAPDGTVVAQNDDGGDRLNSRIRTTLDQSGTYTIWCGSFGRESTGRFELSVEEFEPAERRSIAVGETNEYEIRENDGFDPVRGELSTPVEFEAEADTRVAIRVASEAFDPVAILEGPGGDVVGADDDSGEGTTALVRATLQRSGTYTIWAGSLDGSETGPFTLGVEELEPVERRSIAVGETNEYEIRENDGADPIRGELATPVEFEGEADTRVTVRVASEAFDPVVILVDPDGEVVDADDDSGEGTTALIRTELEQSGTYTIWASSLDGSETGAFTLALEED